MAAALPFDVITEILLWLPVNSLLRFKSVSKAWRQLISDPDFAKLHHSRSIQSHSKLLVVLHQTQNGNNSAFFSGDLPHLDKLVEICPVRSIMNDHSCDKCRERREGQDLSDFLVGSSNGLICVFHQGKFMLSNPSTQTLRMIPCLDMPSIHGCRFSRGFGYDPLSYDYKVLVISWVFRNSCLQTLLAAVYSLNSNSWREVPYPQQSMPMDYFLSGRRLVFVNNAFHWLHKKVHDKTITTITSFDIHDETYREVQLPPIMLGDSGYLKLVNLEDCLCALTLKPNYVVDVWVRNEYETWWKSYVMSQEEIIRPRMGGHEHEILLFDGWEGLVQYDTRDRSTIKIKIIPELSYRQTATIVQSIPIMLSVKSNPSTKGKPCSIFLGMRLWRRQS
ncbi:hypothetical protein Dimus_012487 [Dionaea muscipula]